MTPTRAETEGASLAWLLPPKLQRGSRSLLKVSRTNVQRYHTAHEVGEVDERDLLPPKLYDCRWRFLNEDSASRSWPIERGRFLNI